MKKMMLLACAFCLCVPALAAADSTFEFGNDCKNTLVWVVDGDGGSLMGGGKLAYRQDAAVVVDFQKEDGSPDPNADPVDVIFHAATTGKPEVSIEQLRFRVTPQASMHKQVVYQAGDGLGQCRFRVVK